MRRLAKSLRRMTLHWLDVPQDVILNLPRVTMIGKQQVTIENHRGVEWFSNDLLRLHMDEGKLEVAGSGLVIRTILKDEVWIEGERIHRIDYVD